MVISQYYFSLLILLSLMGQSVFAESALPNDVEKTEIRQIIQAQIDAFLADDAEAAFSLNSPGIKARFGNPKNFMKMVKTGYQPVYRPRAYFFKEIVNIEGQIVQHVLVIDQNEQPVLAIYPMERQQDGHWRIDGCFLTSADSQLL